MLSLGVSSVALRDLGGKCIIFGISLSRIWQTNIFQMIFRKTWLTREEEQFYLFGGCRKLFVPPEPPLSEIRKPCENQFLQYTIIPSLATIKKDNYVNLTVWYQQKSIMSRSVQKLNFSLDIWNNSADKSFFNV